MKTETNEQEIIDVLRQNKAGLDINAIADQIGVHRPVLNPVLSAMLMGKRVVRYVNDGTPLFKLSDDILGADTAATENTTNPSRSEQASMNQARSAQPEHVSAADKNGVVKSIPTELSVLAFLFEKAQKLPDIKAKFPGCQAVLDSLVNQDLVESQYIFDQYVYIVYEERALNKYPLLADEAERQAALGYGHPDSQPEQPAPAIEPEQVATESVARVQPSIAIQLEPEPAIALEVVEPEVLRTSEFSQEQPEPQYLEEISKLINKAVEARIKEEIGKLSGGLDREALANKMAAASEHLKKAAEALDEGLKILLS